MYKVKKVYSNDKYNTSNISRWLCDTGRVDGGWIEKTLRAGDTAYDDVLSKTIGKNEGKFANTSGEVQDTKQNVFQNARADNELLPNQQGQGGFGGYTTNSNNIRKTNETSIQRNPATRNQLIERIVELSRQSKASGVEPNPIIEAIINPKPLSQTLSKTTQQTTPHGLFRAGSWDSLNGAISNQIGSAVSGGLVGGIGGMKYDSRGNIDWGSVAKGATIGALGGVALKNAPKIINAIETRGFNKDIANMVDDLNTYKANNEPILTELRKQLNDVGDDEFSDVVDVNRKNYCEKNSIISRFEGLLKK